MNGAARTRPIGITLLALLVLAGAAIYILGGIIFALGWAQLPPQLGLPPEAAAVLPVALIILGALGLALGLGLWSLRSWARKVAIVLSALGVVGAIVGVGTAVSAGTSTEIVLSFLSVAVRSFILWYLLQPHVKQAFTAPPAAPDVNAPPPPIG
jgi:hypothetical protein